MSGCRCATPASADDETGPRLSIRAGHSSTRRFGGTGSALPSRTAGRAGAIAVDSSSARVDLPVTLPLPATAGGGRAHLSRTSPASVMIVASAQIEASLLARLALGRGVAAADAVMAALPERPGTRWSITRRRRARRSAALLLDETPHRPDHAGARRSRPPAPDRLQRLSGRRCARSRAVAADVSTRRRPRRPTRRPPNRQRIPKACRSSPDNEINAMGARCRRARPSSDHGGRRRRRCQPGSRHAP